MRRPASNPTRAAPQGSKPSETQLGLLRATYAAALDGAQELRASACAMPLLGAGIFNWDEAISAKARAFGRFWACFVRISKVELSLAVRG